MGAERQLSHAEVLGRYAGAFVDALVARGLRDVCLCPGSRSTPLALTFARHPRVKIWTHLDERSCAYFALGMAKVHGSAAPVAILCSSGTAAVNFAPAVVEAAQSHVPLLVLTADRPQELRDLGANQTIDQVRLYGSAAKWFVEMPLPEASEEMLRYVHMVGWRAIETTWAMPQGPVHLNFPFREPLVPAAVEPVFKDSRAEGFVGPINKEEHRFAPDVTAHRRGVIVCGPGMMEPTGSLLELAARLGWPVLADPLSNLRSSPHCNDNVIAGYDSFLRSAALADELAPDFVLRFGAPVTGRPLSSYLQRHRGVRHIVIAEPGLFPDPDLSSTGVIEAYPPTVCDILLERDDLPNADPGWLAAWRRAELKTREVVERILNESEVATEPSVITDLAEVLPDAFNIFAGNSMPVRDIDSFWPATKQVLSFYGNRGASGIDGVVSTALGAAAHYGRTVLVIGDLSFYHDMNGLLAVKRHGISATIVLVNNDGGGIFSFLSQNSEDEEHFETLFGTPHGLDFTPVAQLYGVGFQTVATRQEYKAALRASFDAPGVQIIEVKTDRAENLKLHQRIWREVAAAAVAPEVAK
ncbi:MAG: 2-succinyl-5-enolpyruvyl-6-hydroxy-3-cyclohexene-1-carboxylic-acid synthase [Dehalococcoidia bacterium]|nr:2-succinyl-5-enolpyruvyl-6-hydroxy-3-cyclohexene-1-carboxylic-acid synthase [Dehalococcoidia bacterium]